MAGQIRVEGRNFVNDAGIFRPLFVTSFGTLSQLIQGRQEEARAYMRWARFTGFNGLRFFAGNLAWMNGQTADAAVGVLPAALAMARGEGLYVEVTALTDTKMDPRYDKPKHVRACAAACRDAQNAILEVANEPYHATQDDETHNVANLLQWGREADVPFALGAAEIDELTKPAAQGGVYPTAGGSYSTIHLRRGRVWFQQISRLREMEEVSRHHNCPIMNNEPVGWDEKDVGDSRLANPEAFFLLGASSRAMELGVIGHGTHAIRSELPGPNQQKCAEMLVRGAQAVGDATGTAEMVTFKNGHWEDCPAGGRFVDEAAGEQPGHPNRLWRVHAGVRDNRSAIVLAGVYGDPGLFWRGGWRQTALVDETEHVKVLVAER